MGILQRFGVRRANQWDTPTLVDELLNSPLQAIVLRIYLIVLWLRGSPIKPPPNRAPIRVVCISDTHDETIEDVPDGDLLIHAGDMSTLGTANAIQKQLDWLASLPHPHKVVVTGNHDSWFDIRSRSDTDRLSNRTVSLRGIQVLNNRSITLNFKDGRKLVMYGNASVPKCGGKDNAFQYGRSQHPWSGKIPLDTEILVTHTPPRHHMDLGLGCDGLMNELWQLRSKPRLHVFGHVHCGRGTQAIYWDDCQKAYECLQSSGKGRVISLLPTAVVDRLPRAIIDLVPSHRWIAAFNVVYYGFLSIIWQFLWQGGNSDGTLMVNAGCQDGNNRRLTTKKPFVVEI